MLGKLLDLLPWGERVWQKLRYPPRIEIGLDWEVAPVTTLAGPLKLYRMVSVEIIASKGEEFVVAEGKIEARATASDDWVRVGTLHLSYELPIDVERNRAWSGQLEGASVAAWIEAAMEPPTPVELRVTAQDHHGTTVESNTLETSVEELRRKKTEHL